MIYVECKPDTVLVRTLTGLPAREVIDEPKGKNGVVGRVMSSRNARGLVDEDPLTVQHSYLMSMHLSRDEPATGLRLLHDRIRGNNIVLLCPKLEDWVVRAARDAGTDLQDYNLPRDARQLHGVINHRLSNFQRLVEALNNTPRLRALAGLLRG